MSRLASTPEIKAIIVLDGTGQRICAKYYKKAEFPSKAKQLEFEEGLFKKTRNSTTARMECEVAAVDQYIAVFRCGANVTFYVVGSNEENELILTAVLDGLFESLLSLLKVPELDPRCIMERIELLLLAVDELVDGGIILETDPVAIRDRVMLKGAVPESMSSYSEMTVASALATAREQVARALLK